MNKKIQKFIATFLLLAMTSFNVAFAQEAISPLEAKAPLKNSVEFIRVKTTIAKDSEIKLAFAQKFNANKAVVGDKVNFILAEDLISSDGKVALAHGTQFIGVVEKQVKSKTFNRNARVLVMIKQVKLPSGEIMDISAKVNKKNGELKSPIIANLPKLVLEAGVVAGVGMVAFAMVFSYVLVSIVTGGVAAIALLAPVTAATAGLGLIVCTSSKGVNYKASKGKVIPVVLQSDLELYLN